ncbi:MAG TPA: hypothetical protein P5080_04185 [Candidatus Paceibacterota bacterium]|nr:hypothetical protein [Candidatus Pacearchaeota archaeon]HRZ51120.1 hypothetical protein [Candidatus Paceibacterota bacterium]HSA36873.1 hypothetical protein [Candidatus Paceibacterota bacterium]
MCCGSESSPGIAPLEPVPDCVSSKDEAVDASLKALYSVLCRPFGDTVEMLVEQICGLARIFPEAQIIDKIVSHYINLGDWKAAKEICAAANRKLSPEERSLVFEALKGHGRIDGKDTFFGHWMEFVEFSGYPDDDTIAAKIRTIIEKQIYTNEEDETLALKIVLDNSRPKIIKAALEACAYKGWVGMALVIVRKCQEADDADKAKAAGIVFVLGSFLDAQAAVEYLFGRELLPEEILTVARAAQRSAEKKRGQTHASSLAEG